MGCYRKILCISYKDHVTNKEVYSKIQQAIRPHEDMTIIKRHKLKWYGRVSRSSGLVKPILRGTVKGGRQDTKTEASTCWKNLKKKCQSWRRHHRHHLSLNHEGRWGTTDDFAASFVHFPLFSTALWDLAISRPVHSLMLSSHFLLSLTCLLPPFIVPCKMVFDRPHEQETWPYHCSLHLFMVFRFSCGPIACWILAKTSLLVTWSL